MTHSHLVIKHLLAQLTQFAESRTQRDHRPQWLTDVIQETAELFQPFSGVARVGFECELTEWGWELRMYLGNREVIGGKNDGQTRAVSFEFNVADLLKLFSETQEFYWNTHATSEDAGRSFLTLRGFIGDQPLCMKIYSLPPRDSTPALREFWDGRVEIFSIDQ